MIYSNLSININTKIQNFCTLNNQIICEFASIGNKKNDYTFLNEFKKLDINNDSTKTLFENSLHWLENIKTNRELNKINGLNFNIFTIFENEFGFRISETMHSKLLKMLLNPHEIHGQGNKFLIEFLKILNVSNPEQGIWQVTAEKGRVDILLKRSYPESVIVIENKSNWANDQQNQLYRYWHNNIYLKTKRIDEEFYKLNNDRYQIIYLVPNENKTYDVNITLSKPNYYHSDLPMKLPMEIKYIDFSIQIQEWLEICKKILSEENTRVKEYINQYQLICNNL